LRAPLAAARRRRRRPPHVPRAHRQRSVGHDSSDDGFTGDSAAWQYFVARGITSVWHAIETVSDGIADGIVHVYETYAVNRHWNQYDRCAPLLRVDVLLTGHFFFVALWMWRSKLKLKKGFFAYMFA
jgi:hypothetical protein